MGKCTIDHSFDDVKNKYESQLSILPDELKPLFNPFFAGTHTQEVLNEVFHLLKKYDLVSEEERAERNKQLKDMLENK